MFRLYADRDGDTCIQTDGNSSSTVLFCRDMNASSMTICSQAQHPQPSVKLHFDLHFIFTFTQWNINTLQLS